jgi:TonB-dependent SusC/RagA subfamily outer membrane receptor
MRIKSFSVAVTILLAAFSAMGQRTARTTTRAIPNPQPLFIVDSVVTDMESLLLSPDNIKSIDVLKDSAVAASYGEKARNGVIIIRTKNNHEIFRLQELLNEYHVAEQDRTLPVCIDNVLVKDTSRIIADKKDVIKIEVTEGTYWLSPMEPSKQEAKYINIVTKRNPKTFS